MCYGSGEQLSAFSWRTPRAPDVTDVTLHQTWRTFLQNHIEGIVATDFFTVPTVRLHVLFAFIILEHQRRKVLHFGVMEHPSAEWVTQQIAEAFAERDAPRYLIRDRDAS